MKVIRLAAAAVFAFVRGSWRRTDFLMRRRNLNLPIGTASIDEHGRDVFGTLQQDGALVVGSGARRFDAFADIWALDPDGWSKQRAVTFGLERSGGSFDVTGSYT